ncbi:glycosyltransferase family A protein [Tamlana sp. 2_MG-2023]|uniref:glycosyltransferase family 2 protein n=1 Tax=unclassified Tamlana TaxID=2614803 RepID=UPI0026E46570|nr:MULTISPECIES: glycosyltransferase family A protein [unclassified Tamlana]MDO6760250.1 glycosyltransferase family A protein [Tamlana sp. 2_MG-2023]MDO6790052.1 glycosyltransferase family A protein [Tamlana sp. 1_MG-2023]
MNNCPWVSVIVPAFNRAQYILECLNSVLHQTHRPIELIVVDDESTDDTVSIIQEFKSKNNKENIFEIKIIQQKNSGAPRARNNGFEKSKGEFIQFLDSDDILLSQKIENQLSSFNKNTKLVYSKTQFFIDEKSNTLDKFWGRKLTETSADYFEFPWQTMCALYRRTQLSKKNLWDENLTIHQDWEFSIRQIILTKDIYFLNEVNSLYRFHDSERIGTQLGSKKIIGIYYASLKIYNLLKNKNKIDSFLKKKFIKRFFFCFLKFSEFRNKTYIKKSKSILFEISSLTLVITMPLSIFNSNFFKSVNTRFKI